METVYIVMASDGEYSDREVWVAFVADSEEAAKNIIVEKMAEAREIKKAQQEYWRIASTLEGYKTLPGYEFEAKHGIKYPQMEGDNFWLVSVPMNEWRGKHETC